ncbi:MAG: glutamate-5-semialdehyde dehydrogenase, partial [Oscillospiraceae bacterium]
DVLIPRGGRNLIRSVTENATVPVIETGTGNCHVYVDESADFDMAINIIENAKTQRTGVCNAIENMLINEKIAKDILPKIKARLDLHNVEIRGCKKSLEILPEIKAATDEDYATEFLNYIIALKVVSSVEDAVEHIKKYTTGHSECIVSNNYENICYFTKNIDAAAVYVNASTRFTDGGEFGLGAEIGISTQKLHARGPMGLMELTTIKYAVFGNGQIR